MVRAFAGREGKGGGKGTVRTHCVDTEAALVDAIAAATGEGKEGKEAMHFIECMIDRHDCSKELLEWGSRVAAANSRPPNPQ